jgi:hypothetical protein
MPPKAPGFVKISRTTDKFHGHPDWSEATWTDLLFSGALHLEAMKTPCRRI